MSLADPIIRLVSWETDHKGVNQTMGNPRNPHVQLEFVSDDHKVAVSNLGINPEDCFLFAFAEDDPAAGCKQIKTAVLTRTEAEFDRLAPSARAAGVALPQAILQHVASPQTVFLQDCCFF